MKSATQWSEEDYQAMAQAIEEAQIANGTHQGYYQGYVENLVVSLQDYGTGHDWDKSRSATGISEVLRCPKDDALLHINVEGTAARAIAAWRLANGR